MDLTQASDNFHTYRRHAPHWRANHVIYFVTWCLHDGCDSLTPDERSLVAAAVEHFDRRRYWLLAYVIMDDHVHVMVRLSPDTELQAVVHSWKSFSANQLQRKHGRRGAVWQNESLDRIVRDWEELQAKMHYIAHNPTKRWLDVAEYPWLKIMIHDEVVEG